MDSIVYTYRYSVAGQNPVIIDSQARIRHGIIVTEYQWDDI